MALFARPSGPRKVSAPVLPMVSQTRRIMLPSSSPGYSVESSMFSRSSWKKLAEAPIRSRLGLMRGPN